MHTAMKKTLLVIAGIVLVITAISAQGNYPFTVKKSGSGGRAILFIPGFACSGDVWNETVAQYSHTHTCYVITLAGFAGTPAVPDPDIKGFVDAIARYIQENKIDHPIITGHSLGGVMAEWLAADHPQLVSGIVVVDALPCLPALSIPGFKPEVNPDCAKFIGRFKDVDDKSFYQLQKVSLASMIADTAEIETAVQWSVKSDRVTLALIYCQLFNTDLRAHIAAVKCPALIMLEPGFKTLQSNIADQYKNLAGAKLVYAGKGLHFIMYDDKKWYFDTLKSFIQ